MKKCTRDHIDGEMDRLNVVQTMRWIEANDHNCRRISAEIENYDEKDFFNTHFLLMYCAKLIELLLGKLCAPNLN